MDHDSRLSTQLNLRVTDAEAERIRLAVEIDGAKSINAWIRHLAVTAADRTIRKAEGQR